MTDTSVQTKSNVAMRFSPEEQRCLEEAQALLKQSLPLYSFHGEGFDISHEPTRASYQLLEDVILKKYDQCVKDRQGQSR